MAAITVELPSLLAEHVLGRAELTVEAATVRDVLDTLTRDYPKLAIHLFDETGHQREHVNIFHNGENLRWFTDLTTRPCHPGDRLTIIQAVSGG